MGTLSLLEHQGKQLLRRVGIATPPGLLTASPEECVRALAALGGDVVLKAQVPAGARGRRGGVRRVSSPQEASAAWEGIRAELGPCEVLVERFVPHDNEAYLAIDARGGQILVLASSIGGVDVEQHRAMLLRLALGEPAAPGPGVRRDVAAALSAPGAEVDGLIGSMWRLVDELDALLVEINPVTFGPGGALALDAKVVLDGYAASRHASGERTWPAGVPVPASDGEVDVIDLDGAVGIVGLGAGLSLYLADRLTRAGPGCAYIYDFTRAAVSEWAAVFDRRRSPRLVELIRRGLRHRPDTARAVILNLTSGGTPVDGLAASAVAALAGLEDRVVVHAAGNSADAARSLLDRHGVRQVRTLEDAVLNAARLAA